MDAKIQNQLSDVRKSRGVGATELARRVGVSRQTIYAIEAGTYVPNTEVTLRLARELEVPVEELFSLVSEKPEAPECVPAEVLSATPVTRGQAVRVCHVGARRVGIPVTASPYFLPEADGVVSHVGRGMAELVSFGKEESSAKKMVMAVSTPLLRRKDFNSSRRSTCTTKR